MPGTFLRNKKNGGYEDVGDDVVKAVESGKYEAPDTVTFTDKYDRELTVPYADFRANYYGGGLSPRVRSTADVASEAGDRYASDEYGSGVVNTLKAGAGGLVKGLTVGLADPWQRQQGYHPWVSGGGQLVGALLPVLATEGAAAPEELAAQGGAEVAGELAGETASRGLAARALASTPAGLVGRAGRAVSDVIGGEGVVSRIARAAVGGATEGGLYGAGQTVGRHIMDGDPDLSGEELYSAALNGMVLGGVVGGGLGAVAEGYGGIRSVAGRLVGTGEKAVQDVTRGSALRSAFTEDPGEEQNLDDLMSTGVAASEHEAETGTPFDVPGRVRAHLTRDGSSAVGAIDSYERDLDSLSRLGREADANSNMLERTTSRDGTTDLLRTIGRGQRSIESLRSDDGQLAALRGGDFDPAHLVTLRNQMRDVERMAWALRESDPKVASQLPGRFSQQMQDARFTRMQTVGISPQSTDPEMLAQQVSHQLMADVTDKASIDAGEKAGGLIHQVLGHTSIGRRVTGLLGFMKNPGAGGFLLMDRAIQGGVGGMLGLTKVGALAVGGGEALRALYRDPAVGGMLTAGAAQVLDGARAQPGAPASGPSTDGRDPERALRDFAGRVRATDADQAGRSVSRQVGVISRLSPRAAAAMADVARRRAVYLREVVDREAPTPTDAAQALLREPRSSDGAARRVAEAVRGASHPSYFLLASLQGRLTPEALAAAQAVYPRSVALTRQLLMTTLAQMGGGERLPPRVRRSIETLMGRDPATVGYRAVMQQSSAATMAPGPTSTGRARMAAERPLRVSIAQAYSEGDRLARAESK